MLGKIAIVLVLIASFMAAGVQTTASGEQQHLKSGLMAKARASMAAHLDSKYVLTDLLGENLDTKQGTKSTEEVLKEKKLIGLYFAAQWNPPARGFTPVLAEFYEEVENYNKNELEIVFVSSDSDEESFYEFFGSMPWTAIPYDKRDIAQQLGTAFSVRGIPALIILNKDGGKPYVVSTNGRSDVTSSKLSISNALALWNSK
jgi:nucleoredoxin